MAAATTPSNAQAVVTKEKLTVKTLIEWLARTRSQSPSDMQLTRAEAEQLGEEGGKEEKDECLRLRR